MTTDWEHWLNHPMGAPVPQFVLGKGVDNYWLEERGGTLYLVTVCEECGYSIQKRLEI